MHQHDSDQSISAPGRLKPICPTRFLTRSPAIKAAIDNYSDILDALEEAGSEFGTNTASMASGLNTCLSNGKTMLGLMASMPIIQCLEMFNKSLQSSHATINGMLNSVSLVKNELESLRTNEAFANILKESEEKIAELNLSELKMPRKRKMPKRYEDSEQNKIYENSVEDMYRTEFFQVIDSATSSLDQYFSSTDIDVYKANCDILLEGSDPPPEFFHKYRDFSDSLVSEVSFYRKNFTGNSLEEHRLNFKSMDSSIRRMFPQVENLLRLLLISPASSCQAERSFSALRRMKTWLRNTMTQERLNHVMVCHVHRDKLAKLDSRELAEEFISRSPDFRRRVFGSFDVL